MDAPVRLSNFQRLWLEKTKAAVRAVRISADVNISADARFYELEPDLLDDCESIYWPHTWLGKGRGGQGECTAEACIQLGYVARRELTLVCC